MFHLLAKVLLLVETFRMVLEKGRQKLNMGALFICRCLRVFYKLQCFDAFYCHGLILRNREK